MYTPRDEYNAKMLEILIYHIDHHNAPFSSEKLWQAVSIVMSETEKVECDAEHNKNNVSMDTVFNHSIISSSQGDIENMKSVHSTISTPQKDTNVTNERQIASDIMKETIK